MAEESSLKRKRGQLTYLESLRNEGNLDTKPEAKNKTCAICLGEMTNEFSVFPCGHFFCFECTARIVERESGIENVPGAFSSVRCPSCRARAALAEISYVHPQQERERLLQSEQREIKGSYGSKISAVVRRILTILDADKSQKLLVFSQWTDVLEIISSSLRENDVGFARTEKGKKSFQTALHRFRTEPEISALLLPIKSCASGLNIVEATHVILVEPQMNPAAEAQAVGRVHRIGQNQKTTVHHFVVENTIEEKIVDIERQRALSYHGVVPKNPIIEKITTADVSLMFQDAIPHDGE
uniref:RING-type domain-containing protein n=1 Tax=Rhodosorus marinus TaxID=101924 RepID=A0A6T6KYI4_9RHOD